MKIAVIGSGYVGTTTAAMLACSGYDVVTLDIDKTKVQKINTGKAPFYEVGLDNLLKLAVESGRLKATTQYEAAIPNAKIVISCVGTPDNPDGSSNLTYVFDAAKRAAPHLKPGVVYVQKSTVPVGLSKKVRKFLPLYTPYVSNPEFLREGTAIYDTLLFDRVVIGGEDKAAREKVTELYRSIQSAAKHIATTSGCVEPAKAGSHKGRYITTSLDSAELIKVTANAFLALKISFANNIAKLCDVTGANIKQVVEAVGADSRIGIAFLNAGRGYGGGCFPKDVSGLISASIEHGVDMPIMQAAANINSSMPGYIIHKAEKELGGFSSKRVAVLGLSFKPGTSDIRKSPAINICNQLVSIGAQVFAYDPEANDEAKDETDSSVTICPTLAKCLEQATVVFIATDWQEFSKLTDLVKLAPKLTAVIDCMNILEPKDVMNKNLTYIGVGQD